MKRKLFAGLILALLSFAFITKADRTITGTIKDDQGNPIPFATIKAKGTNVATTSDINGKFTITVNDKVKALEISYVGYKTMTVKLTNKSDYAVLLKPQASNLDEVVVTGYSNTSANTQSAYSPGIKTKMSERAAGVNIAYDKAYKLTPPRILKDEEADDSWRYNGNFNIEGYDHIVENPLLKTNDNPLSTFSIDVDAASYANVRRFINAGELPPAGAVRIEELINYFNYNYPQPQKENPFSINTEVSNCPWNTQHKLVLIGLQGKKISTQNLPASNLIFLIDVSGSMNEEDKLPLVKSSLKLLVDQLRPQDKVAMVVYAGSAGLVLPSTSGDKKIKIKNAIDNLEAGGSTAGGAGIKLAYNTAKENFIKDGNNRVILCTDGDFNVGISSEDGLQQLIENERQSGIFLSVLGFGTGNYQDSKMQLLADKGNGNHNYVDNLSEAKRIFVNEFGGTLFTIAKDVKLQIEFNPEKVQGYRLIGYENRLLNKEDFNDDKKDAGELGSGHTVTALYELIPTGIKDTMLKSVDALRYQKVKPLPKSNFDDEVMNIKLRYKKPDGDKSTLIEHPLKDENISFGSTSDNFRFAAAVAEFGMLLRNSQYKGSADFRSVTQTALAASQNDEGGYRKEFIRLVQTAASLKEKETGKQVDMMPVEDSK
ncbi:MAG TPA: von Willebrand factor type A domain-containing protein [Parafilimonas sp.]|nr:von Willebrand factor type A domain-containing protein [Parafilimonas sp.]